VPQPRDSYSQQEKQGAGVQYFFNTQIKPVIYEQNENHQNKSQGIRDKLHFYGRGKNKAALISRTRDHKNAQYSEKSRDAY
jgi:hypothetical protein